LALSGNTGSGIGLALGGGAARGLAHIVVLEAFDELGVRPAIISGTSMGAIIGACYAAGIPASDIRDYATDFFATRLAAIRRMFPGDPSSWGSIFSFRNTALLSPENLMDAVLPPEVPAKFGDLQTPLQVVATDFHREDQYVISAGSIRPAVGASSALPVLLAPVRLDGRVLIDGGFVNPTPFDIIGKRAAGIVAVDVTGNGLRSPGDMPGAIESWIGASQIALHSLVNERLKRIRPDVLIRPDVGSFASMDFHRIDEILAAAERSREMAKRQISALVERL
jgi:NTE family protein